MPRPRSFPPGGTSRLALYLPLVLVLLLVLALLAPLGCSGSPSAAALVPEGAPVPARQGAPCSHYAAPVVSEGGVPAPGVPAAVPGAMGSAMAPLPVQEWWARARPGATLCLLPGEYRGRSSMVNPPRGLSGLPDAPLTIRALRDGTVWIDGEHEHLPVWIAGDYWLLEGFDAFDSSGPVVSLGSLRTPHRSRGITVRRVVAWRDPVLAASPIPLARDRPPAGDPPRSNVMIWAVIETSDLLLEDVAGFGRARKIAQIFRSERAVVRRGWFRWDGRWPHLRGQEYSISCAYRSTDVLCENVLATAGGSHDPRVAPADYDPGVWGIATDAAPHPSDRGRPGRDRFDFGLRVVGSLVYYRPDAAIERLGGILMGGTRPYPGMKGVTLDDVAVYAAPHGHLRAKLSACIDEPREAYQPTNHCSWKRGANRQEAPKVARHLSLAGGEGSYKDLIARQDWQVQGLLSVAPGAGGFDLYHRAAGGRGARLCKRSVDGRETDEPLWPWPMQERIRAATARSLWPEADVMAELRALFGDPPPECTRSSRSEGPVPGRPQVEERSPGGTHPLEAASVAGVAAR